MSHVIVFAFQLLPKARGSRYVSAITIRQNRGDTSAHVRAPDLPRRGFSLCPAESPHEPADGHLSRCGFPPRRRALLQSWTWTKSAGEVRCARLESSTKSGAHSSNRGVNDAQNDACPSDRARLCGICGLDRGRANHARR